MGTLFDVRVLWNRVRVDWIRTPLDRKRPQRIGKVEGVMSNGTTTLSQHGFDHSRETKMKNLKVKLLSAFVVGAIALTPLALGANTAGASHYPHLAVWHVALNSTFTKTSSVNSYSTNVCAADVSGDVEVYKNGNDIKRWHVPLCVNYDPLQTDNVSLGLGTNAYTFELKGQVNQDCTGVCRMSVAPPTPQSFCVDFSGDFQSEGDNSYLGSCRPGSTWQTSTNNVHH